ncbi:MAG: protein-L-isoaspartate O-methyltransferase [Spirochaetaceae bacterium]|jgi:protein-L-isoaspartate(D-aspartate) O-methyltransferase|nr:protein-L-isoaspartate O-methyltransferase [Spirochaetaceae bacterium]
MMKYSWFLMLICLVTIQITAETSYDITSRPQVPTSSAQEFRQWALDNTDQELKFIDWRYDSVLGEQAQGSWAGFRNDRVLQAYLRTPREYFCRSYNKNSAYAHSALPIGYGQTISGIYAVGRMTDWLNPSSEDKVLEIGTGSGYQSAVLAQLSEHVYTIEIVEELAEESHGIYDSLKEDYPELGNITYKIDDGYYGWEEYAPFDKIIVTCGIDHIPPALLRQLKTGGQMLIPVGPPSGQTILSVTKEIDEDGNMVLDRVDIYGGRIPRSMTTFVPFTDNQGGTHYQN